MDQIIKRGDGDIVYGGLNEVFLKRVQGGVVNWVPYNPRIIELTFDELKEQGYVLFGDDCIPVGLVLQDPQGVRDHYPEGETRTNFEEKVYWLQDFVKEVYNF